METAAYIDNGSTEYEHNGTHFIIWRKDGDWHRDDGPAYIESTTGSQIIYRWYFKGEPCTFEEWSYNMDLPEEWDTYYRLVYAI